VLSNGGSDAGASAGDDGNSVRNIHGQPAN
jgi:hypothetical protein